MDFLSRYRKKIIFSSIALLVTVIILSLLAFLPVVLGSESGYFKNYLKYLMLKTNLIEPSQLFITAEGETLKLTFKIAKQDREKATTFLDNLIVNASTSANFKADNEGQIFFDIKIDEQNMTKLAKLLPIQSNLDFADKRLSLNTLSLLNLKSGVINSKYDFATGSGKFEYQSDGEGDYRIKVEDPTAVLNQATESGVLSVSHVLTPWFEIIERVAKINLEIERNDLDGDIYLKD